MRIINITDLSAPELDIYARMSENQLAHIYEPASGLFIAESPKVIERALDAGYEPVSILLEDRHVEGQCADIIKRCGDIPIYTAPFDVLTKLTGFALTRGMLCAMRRAELPSVESVCEHAARIAVLEEVMNPTNVGAIFRSAVNQMGISWLNFVTKVAILCVYVCQYEAGIVSRLIAVLLYMGIMGVAEPLGYLFNKAFMEKVLDDTTVSYYFIVFFMALLKATIVEVFCRLKSGKSIRLSAMPKETQYMLTMIPLCSLISCFLLIEVAKELISAQMVVLCMCIIFVIIITNYVIFLMIEKYTTVEEKQHEEEMIQREILYRNEYYQDMERYQEQIQDIRHDMKNRLTGLLAAAEQGSAELIKDRLQEVLGDIRLAEEIIYSANPVVNAILKVKSVKAKEKEIPMQVTTLLPQRVSVDIGDMGVLYGNLLDNAIEAAMAVEQEKRYVHVESKFQEGRLLLSIKNSKPSGTSSYQQTSKKDKIKHGRGIRSVRKVAEKYGGELMLKDQGEHLKVCDRKFRI